MHKIHSLIILDKDTNIYNTYTKEMDELKLCFKPCNHTWIKVGALEKIFNKKFSAIFTNMRVCGMCGITTLHNFQWYIQYVDNQFCGENLEQGCTRYGVANYIMSKHNTDASGLKINVCNKCRGQRGQNQGNPYVEMHSPEYLACILKVHPIKVQLLSFVDISLRIEENKYGFVSGQIEDFSLLHSPLVSSEGSIDDKGFFEELVDELQPIIEGNSRNRWFNMYLTNFESSNNRSTSVCVLSQEVIQSILEKHDTGSKSCCDEEDGSSVENLSILLNMGRSSQGNVSKDFYVVGNIRDRA